ncbi:1a/1b [Blackcurrant leafroll-associated virus 1]|uniref:1a/1b n=1 Tax=Blackcurrant leafroll-associated virus 1 TaxID=2292426 RepID=UPI000EB787E6|nr:1a/1b [Blackcurrant leafroll-associated virus 1]AYA58347.1 1a/1b [Blackcurrant leafroll-associated virus 1]
MASVSPMIACPSDAELELLEAEYLRSKALAAKPPSNEDPLSALCDRITFQREAAKDAVQSAALSACALTVVETRHVNRLRRPTPDSQHRESLRRRRSLCEGQQRPTRDSLSRASPFAEMAKRCSLQSPRSVACDFSSTTGITRDASSSHSPLTFSASASDDITFANMYLNNLKSLCLVNAKRNEMKVITTKRTVLFRGYFRYPPTKQYDPAGRVVRSVSHPQFCLSLHSKRGSSAFSKGGCNTARKGFPVSPKVTQRNTFTERLVVRKTPSFKPKSAAWHLVDASDHRTRFNAGEVTAPVRRVNSELLQDVGDFVAPEFLVATRCKVLSGAGCLLTRVADYLLSFYAGHRTFYDFFRNGDDVVRLSVAGDFVRLHSNVAGVKKIFSLCAPRYSKYFSALKETRDFSSFQMKTRPANGFCYVEHLFSVNLETGLSFPFKKAFSLGAFPKASAVFDFISEHISGDLRRSSMSGSFAGGVFHCHRGGDFHYVDEATIVGGLKKASPFNETTTYYAGGKSYNLGGEQLAKLPQPRNKRCYRCKHVSFDNSLDFLRYVQAYVVNYVVAGGVFYDKFRNTDASSVTVYVRNLKAVTYWQSGGDVSCATSYDASEYVNHFGELVLHVTNLSNYRRCPRSINGQCYLQFVFECCVGCGIAFDARKAIEALRILPTLKCLLAYVKSLGLVPPSFLRGYFTSRTLFHCDINSTRVVSVNKFGGSVVIGGVTENSPSLVQDQELLQAVSSAISRSGVNRDSLLVRSVETEAIRVNEAARNERNKRPSQVIPYQMSEEKQALLVNAFPEFNLKFTHSTLSNHALAASCRLLENGLHHKKAGSEYVDVGGCPKYHLLAGHTGVHICRPVCDLKDAQRKVLREHSIIATETLPHNLYDKVTVAGCGLSACSKMMSECDVKTSCMVATQVYDLSLTDMANAMQMRGAAVFFFSLITPGEFLTDRDAFRLSALEVDIIVSREDDRVTYVFGHTTYSHSLSNLLTFMQTSHFRLGSDLFSVEMYEVRCGVNFYQMTRSSRCPKYEGSHLLRFPYADPGVTKVKIPRFDRQSRCCLPGADYLYLDADFVEKIYLFTVNACQNVNSKTFDYVWNHIKNAKARLVISGKIVRRDVSLDISEIESFAAVMLAAGVRSRLTAECFSKKISLAVNEMSISSMLKYAVSEKLRHMRFLFRSKFTTAIKRICKDAFDIDFLEATDLITSIGTHAEIVVNVSLQRSGSIPANEETNFIAAQAARLIRNSLERDTIVEVGDEVLLSRAAEEEKRESKKLNTASTSKSSSKKGGLAGAGVGDSVVRWVISSLSNLIVKTPGALKDCLRNVAKLLSSIEMVPKFRKLLSVILNPLIFDDTVSVSVELLAKCFSKLLSAWGSYQQGGMSFRAVLRDFTLSVVVDCTLSIAHNEKPSTLLDSQMRCLLTDYISKACVFGVSPISLDGILTLSGVLVTVFRKVVSRCLDENTSTYAGYYNNNAIDSPLIAYLRRECLRLGVGIGEYLKCLIRDTISEMVSAQNMKEYGKKCCSDISGKVKEGTEWLTSYFKGKFRVGNEEFFDATEEDLDSGESTSVKGGLGGGSRCKSIISVVTLFFGLKACALFKDYPEMERSLLRLARHAEFSKRLDLTVMIERFLRCCSKWRGKKYTNIVLSVGSSLYYLLKFTAKATAGGVWDLTVWVARCADQVSRLVANCGIIPKPIRKVFKGVVDVVRSSVYMCRLVVCNPEASGNILLAKVSGIDGQSLLAQYSKTISLGLKACYFKDSRWIGTYVDINPKERCNGGVYYDFQSDISETEIANVADFEEHVMGFDLHDDENLACLTPLNIEVLTRDEFAKKMGLFGGGGGCSFISELLKVFASAGLSFVKTQAVTSILSILCESSCTLVGCSSLVLIYRVASKADAVLRLARFLRSEREIIKTCDYLLLFNNRFGFKFIETQLLRLREKAKTISECKGFKLIVRPLATVVDISDEVARVFLSVPLVLYRLLSSIATRSSRRNNSGKRGDAPSLSEEFEFSDDDETSDSPGLKAGGRGVSIIGTLVKIVMRCLFTRVPLKILYHITKIFVFKHSLSLATHESLVYSFIGCVLAWLSKGQLYTGALVASKLPTKDEAFDLISRCFNALGDGVVVPDRLTVYILRTLDFVYGRGVISIIREGALRVVYRLKHATGGERVSGVSFSAVPVTKVGCVPESVTLQTLIDDIVERREGSTKDAPLQRKGKSHVTGDKGKGVSETVVETSDDSDSDLEDTKSVQGTMGNNGDTSTEKPDLIEVAKTILPEVVDVASTSKGNRKLKGKEVREAQGELSPCAYLKTLNLGVVTPSPFAVASGKGCTLTNSVREFYYLQEVALFEVYVKCMKYYQEANALNFDRGLLTCNEDSKLVLYDCASRRMQMKNRVYFKSWEKVYKEDGFRYCFSSDGLVPFTSETVRGKKVVLHEDIAFLPQNLFLRAVSGNNFRFTNSEVSLRLYEAPPGGGKTHTLIDLFSKCYAVVNALVLTANKNSQIEISEKVMWKIKGLNMGQNEEILSVQPYVCTIDSYLMHSPERKCEILFVDECFMVHAGEVLAALEFTKCKVALLFGDSRQIHYIHRGELEASRFSDLNNYIDGSGRIYGNKSYRCPWDVCEWLSKQYENKISSVAHNTVGESSCSVKLVECEEDLEISPHTKYLTYTQEEKHRVQAYLNKRHLKSEVNTVHEVQGETYTKVDLVRFKFQEDAPFSSMNHIVVALSRHTRSLVYNVLGARSTDRTCVEIEKMKKICEEFRKNPYTNTSHSYSISGITPAPDHNKSKPCSAPIEIINYWLDDVLPGCGFGDMGDPSDEMRSSPFECGVDNVVVTDAAPKESVSTQQRVNYVKSQAIPKRKASLQENLYSFESRNYNFIDSAKFSDPTLFGFCMAENFFKRCCHFDRIAEIKNEIIALSDEGFRTWFEKRDAAQLKALYRDMEDPYDIEMEINRFKLMVKSDAKVKLDASSLVKHPPAQNIMFHRKVVNAVYSQCFDEFKNRLIYVLKDNIKLYTEMSLGSFGDMVGSMLGYTCDYNVGEVDFSKFDKSQDKFIKAFERRIYESFGFEAELLDVWMEGEYLGKARTLDGQLGFQVENQRRSGASNTWVGNSLVTLGILSLYYDVEKFDALFVSGDDSLIFSRNPIKNYSDTICLETGFETKFMTPSVPYFCSKFLVFTGNRVVFVPDPYKLLVKLGAPLKDVSVDYLKALYESFKDLTTDFDDQVVIDLLTELVHLKHNFCSVYTNTAICSIHCLRSNFKTFRRLYPEVRGWMMVSAISNLMRKILPDFVVRKYPGVAGVSIEFLSDLNSSDPHPFRNPESVF